MVLFNTSQFFGLLITQSTQEITGSLFLTLFMILTIFIGLMLSFRVPIELVVIFTMPLIIVIMAFESSFLIIGGILIMLLSFILAILWFKN